MMRAIFLLSAALLIGNTSQAFAEIGGLPIGLDQRQSRAEHVGYCGREKYHCLENVGRWTRFPSQRTQCVIRYDQCLNR